MVGHRVEIMSAKKFGWAGYMFIHFILLKTKNLIGMDWSQLHMFEEYVHDHPAQPGE